MKTQWLALLVCFVAPLSAADQTRGNTPIEPNATISEQLKNESAVVEALAKQVRGNGYRCDSISVARMMLWSRGFVLVCNRFAYEYEIEDKGGRWRVTVK